MPLKPPDPQAVVIFGASGDLTRRKLIPAFWHLFVERLLPEGFAVVGYARTEAENAVNQFGKVDPEGELWEDFGRRLSYVSGEFESENAMQHLRHHLEEVDQTFGANGGRLFYCAVPPMAYPQIVARIQEAGMHEDSKIVIEKPFGFDLDSSRELNDELHKVFREGQIFRIDHYLGKETVQNILALRFANGMFEPIWNRRYVDNVQITVAESIGIEGRAAFFEQVGTIRDMVQTHLFQVMTFVAMEPPVAFEPHFLLDEKVKVLQAARRIDPARVVRGQYRGYRDERDVAKDSQTETFAALEVQIENWRWAGVPFFLRTGKKLQRKATEVTLSFRDVPFNVFEGTGAGPQGTDHLVLRIQPNEGITLQFNIKKPTPGFEFDRATLDFDYQQRYDGPVIMEAYELLLLEAMEGDQTLFTREDSVERAWQLLMPVLEDPSPVVEYEPGSWGPEEADALVSPRRWHICPPREGQQTPLGM